jgi:hypothetical protein
MRAIVYVVMMVLLFRAPKRSKESQNQLFIVTPLQFFISFLLVGCCWWKPKIFNDFSIPVIIALNYIIIDPTLPMGIATFVFE